MVRGSAAALLALLTLGAAVVGADAATGANKCPSTPLQRCDFYVLGHSTTLPEFKLRAFAHDTILSVPIRYKDGREVQFANNGDGCFFIPQPKKSHKCASAFFFAGSGANATLHANKIGSRNIPPGNLKYFANKCVLFPINELRIAPKKPSKTPVYLNPFDSNTVYPEAKRCVVFRTTI